MTLGTKWYVRRCAAGTGAAMCVYLLTLALCAYLTVRGFVGEEWMARCVWLCALIASFTGTIFGSIKTVRCVTMALCCSLTFYLAVILPGLLAGGTFALVDALRLPAPIALGSAIALMRFRKKGRDSKRGRHSRRRR